MPVGFGTKGEEEAVLRARKQLLDSAAEVDLWLMQNRLGVALVSAAGGFFLGLWDSKGILRWAARMLPFAEALMAALNLGSPGGGRFHKQTE